MVKGTVPVALAFVLGAGLFADAPLAAPQRGARETRGSALTARDYLEIQQLVARSSYALDSAAENGDAYAGLFTADGVLRTGTSASSEVKGRDGLAAFARADSRTRDRCGSTTSSPTTSSRHRPRAPPDACMSSASKSPKAPTPASSGAAATSRTCMRRPRMDGASGCGPTCRPCSGRAAEPASSPLISLDGVRPFVLVSAFRRTCHGPAKERVKKSF